MLPPKRSTRSTHLATQSTGTILACTHEQEIPPTRLPVLLPLPEENSNSEIHFVHSTPQNPKMHPVAQADSLLKKARRKLTTPQRLALEELASHGNNPPLEARRALAEGIGLEVKVISVWFQNKRRPTNRLLESTPADTCETPEIEKANQGNRQILADVNVNCNTVPGPSHSASISPSYIESPSASASEPCQLDNSHLEIASTSESRGPQNRRRSLEWACLNDKRTTKRARPGPGLKSQGPSNGEPALNGSAPNRRRRTDKKPHMPSPRVRKSKVTALEKTSLMHTGSFNDGIYIEKDVFDVALALVQLKGQGHARLVRKSI